MPTIPYVRTTHSVAGTWTAAKANVVEAGVNDISFAPAVRAFHSAAQSVTSGTPLVLAFNSETLDQAGNAADTMHDTATNNSRLTCRYAGVYQITAQVEWAANATGYRRLAIRHSAGPTFIAESLIMCVTTASVPTRQNVTALYPMAVNEYVEAIVDQNSGGALNVTSAAAYTPYFMMVRVG